MIVQNKRFFYSLFRRNKIRRINSIQEMEIYTKKCHHRIDGDFIKIQKKNHQIWITYDGEIRDTKFDCRLKGEMRTVLHSNRTRPRPLIGDACWLIRVSFGPPNCCILFYKRPAPSFITKRPATLVKLLCRPH